MLAARYSISHRNNYDTYTLFLWVYISVLYDVFLIALQWCCIGFECELPCIITDSVKTLVLHTVLLNFIVVPDIMQTYMYLDSPCTLLFRHAILQ